MDWRNQEGFRLGRLQDLAALEAKLRRGPLHGVYVEPKFDGHRYSFQFGGGLPPLLVSRSKEGARKGSAASKDAEFGTREVPAWGHGLEHFPLTVLDGELLGLGDDDESANHRVSALDTPKTFAAFDVLHYERERDIRLSALTLRRGLLTKIVRDLGRQEIAFTAGTFHSTFGQDTLDKYLKLAIETKVEGFVLKIAMSPYKETTIGFKIKPEMSHDGIVIDVKAKKDHHLGAVTKTDEIGVLVVAQIAKDGKRPVTAYVPWHDGTKLADKAKVIGSVVEFTSKGWNPSLNQWRFPQFARFRLDKDAEECTIENARLAK